MRLFSLILKFQDTADDLLALKSIGLSLCYLPFLANDAVVKSDEGSSTNEVRIPHSLIINHILEESLIESDNEEFLPSEQPPPTLENPPSDAPDSDTFDDTSSENTPVLSNIMQHRIV